MVGPGLETPNKSKDYNLKAEAGKRSPEVGKEIHRHESARLKINLEESMFTFM